MTGKPTIPFYCPRASIPAPLPTVAEILASKEYLFTFLDRGSIRVVRIGRHFIVKYGPSVLLQEGENMLFVQQNTSVRVPAVYALFHDQESGFNFIIQEYIPGKDMNCWKEIETDKRETAIKQLRAYFDELRRLPSPGYFGGIWRQELLDSLFRSAKDEPGKYDAANLEPCNTEEEWVDAMLASAQLVYRVEEPQLQFLERMYKSVFRNHRPVFTHGDLTPQNVRIHEDDGAVVLVDWETSGWYPSCWEFCLAMSAADITSPKAGGWYASIPRFLDAYPSELGWMMHFRPWIQYGGVDGLVIEGEAEDEAVSRAVVHVTKNDGGITSRDAVNS